MENEKEELGKIIFDGKLTNLDKASEKELDELKKKIKEKKEGFYITLANIDNSRYLKNST